MPRSLRSVAVRFTSLALPLSLSLCGLVACASETPAAPTSLGVEEASRNLELGRAIAPSKALLEVARYDRALPAREREDAVLALVDSLEAQPDKEGAIVALEDFLASESREPRASEPSTERAQKKLRQLLGMPEPSRRELPRNQPPVIAPIARALVAAFPPDAEKRTSVKLLSVGGSREISDNLGTWNLAGAVEAMAKEACSLCDSPRTHTQSTHGSTFLALVRDRDLAKSSLVAIYYDREDGVVPARYEAWLALPLAELNARLDRGEGVVAVKSREGAPPLVLLAAPRQAQLAAVEESFAALKALPTEPVRVTLSPALRPTEIQAAVRGARGEVKACYETLLAKNPLAAGRVTLDFMISPSGAVQSAKVTGTGTANEDALLSCLVRVTEKLTFPSTATSAPTTVRYPLDLAPLASAKPPRAPRVALGLCERSSSAGRSPWGGESYLTMASPPTFLVTGRWGA